MAFGSPPEVAKRKSVNGEGPKDIKRWGAKGVTRAGRGGGGEGGGAREWMRKLFDRSSYSLYGQSLLTLFLMWILLRRTTFALGRRYWLFGGTLGTGKRPRACFWMIMSTRIWCGQGAWPGVGTRYDLSLMVKLNIGSWDRSYWNMFKEMEIIWNIRSRKRPWLFAKYRIWSMPCWKIDRHLN